MANPKHISLKDLARELGVSVPTVSRALKDSPEISADLRARAKQLAQELNYRPNPFAISLRKMLRASSESLCRTLSPISFPPF